MEVNVEFVGIHGTHIQGNMLLLTNFQEKVAFNSRIASYRICLLLLLLTSFKRASLSLAQLCTKFNVLRVLNESLIFPNVFLQLIINVFFSDLRDNEAPHGIYATGIISKTYRQVCFMGG